jgi:hypothetical protein
MGGPTVSQHAFDRYARGKRLFQQVLAVEEDGAVGLAATRGERPATTDERMLPAGDARKA